MSEHATGWWAAVIGGKAGYVPGAHFVPLPPSDSAGGEEPLPPLHEDDEPDAAGKPPSARRKGRKLPDAPGQASTRPGTMLQLTAACAVAAAAVGGDFEETIDFDSVAAAWGDAPPAPDSDSMSAGEEEAEPDKAAVTAESTSDVAEALLTELETILDAEIVFIEETHIQCKRWDALHLDGMTDVVLVSPAASPQSCPPLS